MAVGQLVRVGEQDGMYVLHGGIQSSIRRYGGTAVAFYDMHEGYSRIFGGTVSMVSFGGTVSL